MQMVFESIVAWSRNEKSDSISALRRPTIVKRDIKIDPEIEQKNIKEILGDLDDDSDDVAITTDCYTPVGLNEAKREFPAVKIESDDKHSPLAYPEDLNEFFGRPQQQLFILQVIFSIFCSIESGKVKRSPIDSYQIHCQVRDQMKNLPIQRNKNAVHHQTQ